MSLVREPLKPVAFSSFIRKLQGSSQSSLVRADDLQLYVVKMHGHPFGRHTVMNEVLTSIIAADLGLPVAGWRLIEVPVTEQVREPGIQFTMDNAESIMADGELHFASKVVLDSDGQPAKGILPGRWLSRMHDRSPFIGMLALDAWLNARDSRQAVFVLNGDASVSPVFIDHGHSLSGCNGFVTDLYPCQPFFSNCSVYAGWVEESMDPWAQSRAIAFGIAPNQQ